MAAQYFTLFLHADWTRVSMLPPETQEYKDLVASSQKVIPLSTNKPRLLRFLVAFVSLGTFFFSFFSVAWSAPSFMQWRTRYGTQSAPCFVPAPDPGLNLAVSVIDYCTTVIAFSGFLVSLAILFPLRLSRSYLGFAVWWSRRNYGLVLWCILRAVLMLFSERNEVVTLVVTVLTPPLFAGIDFMILLSDKGTWVLFGFKAFFALNALGSFLTYLHTIVVRNQCDLVMTSSLVNVVGVFYVITTAGRLLAVVKLNLQKLRNIYPPALPYGIASHIVHTPVAPGAKALMVMNEGGVTIVPFEALAALSGTQVTYTQPSDRLRRVFWVWAVVSVSWMVLSFSGNAIEVSRYQADPKDRCWRIEPPKTYYYPIPMVSAALALVLVSVLLAVILVHGLGPLTARWCRFWARRNWLLVCLCVARGLIRFRPEYTLNEGVADLVNFCLLPIALSTFDLLIILQRQHGIFLHIYRLFCVHQTAFMGTSYVVGLAHDTPCGLYTPVGSNPKTTFFVGKLQNMVQLFFSLHFLSLIFTIKFLSGIAVPILKLSDKDKFAEGSILPKHRLSKVGSRFIQEEDVTWL
jgi:hypothetical protein